MKVLHDFRNGSRNFWKLCKTSVPFLGTLVTPVKLWHNIRGTGMLLLQYPGSSVSIQVYSK